MRVTVLGGCGFIGSAIVRALRDEGAEVTIVGRPEAASDGTDISTLTHAIASSNPDTVVHAASAPGWSRDDELRRLRALASLNVPAIVMGSAAVLAGSAPNASERFDESVAPHPLSEYGAFKLAQEQDALALRANGWSVSIVRLFNPIGPNMKPSLMLGRLVRQIAEREHDPSLSGDVHMGDLSAYRDFCHVGDAAEAVAAIVRLPALPPMLHVGSGRATLTRDVAALALAASSRPGLRIIEDPSSAGPVRVISDSSQLRKLTGWAPRRTLQSAVEAALAAARAPVTQTA